HVHFDSLRRTGVSVKKIERSIKRPSRSCPYVLGGCESSRGKPQAPPQVLKPVAVRTPQGVREFHPVVSVAASSDCHRLQADPGTTTLPRIFPGLLLTQS